MLKEKVAKFYQNIAKNLQVQKIITWMFEGLKWKALKISEA